MLSFTARRLANAAVVMRNSSLRAGKDERILARYAYGIPREQFNEEQWGKKHATFYAERYGGQGILSHGGGVRCGTRGGWQVKGIGRNLLAGADVNVEDSNGCLHLPEALREALWGELCHYALPFGAVRAAAVIATGADIQYGTATTYSTGLVVRQAALRPAHFIRSLYFRPGAKLTPGTPSDSERVRSAIQQLPNSLPRPLGMRRTDWSNMQPLAKLHCGLNEVARRFAEQTAAAQARRIMHGAITPSNVALDGRWLDFGTMSVLPGYGNIKYLQRFWDDPNEYRKIFADLCFYVSKYFRLGQKSDLPTAEQLANAFASHYISAARRRFLQLTGVPNLVAAEISSSVQSLVLCDLLFQIARSSHNTLHYGYPGEDDPFGEYSLGKILTLLARWHQDQTCENRLGFLVPNHTLRYRLISSYRDFSANAYAKAAGHGISATTFRRLIVINAKKAAWVEPLFLRKNLVSYTERIDRSYVEIDELRTRADELLTSITDRAQVLYAEPEGFSTRVMFGRDLNVRYEAGLDQWVLLENETITTFPWHAIQT
jgi:hypothetical protein